jgi:hypothetical protein
MQTSLDIRLNAMIVRWTLRSQHLGNRGRLPGTCARLTSGSIIYCEFVAPFSDHVHPCTGLGFALRCVTARWRFAHAIFALAQDWVSCSVRPIPHIVRFRSHTIVGRCGGACLGSLCRGRMDSAQVQAAGRAARDLSEASGALRRSHSLAVGKPNIRHFPVPHPEPGQAEISGGSTRAVHQLFVSCIWQRVSFFVAFNEFFVDFGI